MQKLPRLSGKEVIKIIVRIGFTPTRQKGSHVILKNKCNKIFVIPLHEEIDRGTLLEIIRQAGLKREDFLRLVG